MSGACTSTAARNGTRSAVSRPVTSAERVVGVHLSASQAREVLGGGRHAGRSHAFDRGAGARRDPARVAVEGAKAHHGGGATRHVGHRRQVDVHPGTPQLATRPASAAPYRRGVALQRLPGDRTGPAHRADLAALLVDHDESAAARLALDRAGEPAPLGGAPGVEAEQDHPSGLARPQAPADVVRRRGVREARDDQLPDLLAQAEAVDRGEGALRRSSCACSAASAGAGSVSCVVALRRLRHPRRRRNAAPRAGSRRRAAGRSSRIGGVGRGVTRQLARSSAPAAGARRPPSSSRPAQRQPSVRATSPNASTGPSAPVPWSPPSAAQLSAPGEHAAGERVAVDAGHVDLGQLTAGAVVGDRDDVRAGPLARASASGPPVEPLTKRSPASLSRCDAPGRLAPSENTCIGRESGPNQPR